MRSLALVLVGLVLGLASLQLQSAWALSPYRHSSRGPARSQSGVIAVTSLIETVEQDFQVSVQPYICMHCLLQYSICCCCMVAEWAAKFEGKECM